jgi:hypothetical protein
MRLLLGDQFFLIIAAENQRVGGHSTCQFTYLSAYPHAYVVELAMESIVELTVKITVKTNCRVYERGRYVLK